MFRPQVGPCDADVAGEYPRDEGGPPRDTTSLVGCGFSRERSPDANTVGHPTNARRLSPQTSPKTNPRRTSTIGVNSSGLGECYWSDVYVLCTLRFGNGEPRSKVVLH